MSLKFLTAGESHGPALCGIIEGLPAGIEVAQEDFDLLLQKRWAGYGRGARKKIESDRVEVLSGIVAGHTIGSPVSLLIRNQDYQAHKSSMAPFGNESVRAAINVPLPGHADFAGAMKFNFDDCRYIRERASARETAMRSALSVPARNFLQMLGIGFTCLVESIGAVDAEIDYRQPPQELAAAVDSGAKEFLCPDHKIFPAWKELIDKAKTSGHSLGGTAAVVFWNLPIGLGGFSQADQRLDARLAAGIFSIPGVKGVECGHGLDLSRKVGMNYDALSYEQKRGFVRNGNIAAGIEGGLSNGEPLIMRFHLKPLPGGAVADSLDLKTLEAKKPAAYRSDTQALQAAAVVAESVVAMEIAAEILAFTGGVDFENIFARLEQVRSFRLRT